MALNQAFTIVIDIRVGNQVRQATQQVQQAGNTVQNLGRQAGKTTTAVGQLAGAFTGFFAAGMIRRGFEALLKPAIELESALGKIAALTGVRGVGLQAFAAEARRVAAITPYGPKVMTEALLELRRSTGSTKDALSSLEATATLATASFGALDTSQSVKMMGELTRSFGLTGEEASDAAERVFAVGRATGLGVENFSRIMGRLAVANTVGAQSFDEVLKAFALANRQIRSPERATTRLISAFRELGRVRTQEVLRSYGVEATDASGGIRRFSDIMLDLAELSQRSGKMARRAIDEAFGHRGAEPLQIIVNQLTGAFKNQEGQVIKLDQVYKYLGDSVRDSAGNLRDAAKARMETPEGRLALTKEKFTLLLESLGKQFLPALVSITDALSALAQGLTAVLNNKWVGAAAAIALKIVAFKVALWGARAALYGVKTLIAVVSSNIGSVFGPAVKSVTRDMQLMGVAAKATGVAAKLMWGGLTLGIAFLPELYAWADEKFFKPMADKLTKLAKTGEGSWFTKTWYSLARRFLPEFANAVDGAVKNSEKLAKQQEIAKQHVANMYEKYQLANQEMDKLRSKMSALSNFRPPEIRGQYFSALEQRLGAARGRVKGSDKSAIDAALNAGDTARTLMAKAQRGTISADEHAVLMNTLADMGALGTHINTLYGGIIGQNLVQKFGKHVLGETSRIGESTHRDYSARIARLSGFKYATTGGQIPGTQPYGGYKAGFEPEVSYMARMYRKPAATEGEMMPWTRGEEYKKAYGQSKLPAGHKYTHEQRLTDLWESYQSKQVSAVQEVTRALSKVLRVEIVEGWGSGGSESDPLGSSGPWGQPGYGPRR